MATKTQKTLKLKKDGTPRKARGPMLPEHKAAMQAGRNATKADREAAGAAVTNPQFQNAKFWKSVDGDVRNVIVAAIQKAQKGEKKAEIAALEAKLAILTANVEG